MYRSTFNHHFCSYLIAIIIGVFSIGSLEFLNIDSHFLAIHLSFMDLYVAQVAIDRIAFYSNRNSVFKPIYFRTSHLVEQCTENE